MHTAIRLTAFVLAILLAEPGAPAKPLHHYVFFGQDREQIRTSAALVETPELEGAQVAYSWRRLEPEKDAYDFSAIREDLAFLSSKGKRLFVQIQDVSFVESRVNVPRYLLEDPRYHGGADRQYDYEEGHEDAARPAGWMARRWDAAVRERFQKLLAALGREFDGKIEGVNLAETACEVGETGRLFPKSFSFEAYRDGIVDNMRALRRAFPKSVVLVYANFMPGEWQPWDDKGYLRSVYKAAAELNVGVGGPDLLPYKRGQMNNSYHLIRDVSKTVTVGMAVQEGNYVHVNPKTGKRITIVEIVGFARDYLGADYVFWCTEEPYFSDAVVPFVRRSGS